MNRLASLALGLGLIALAGAATAKDLAGVYEDALHSDPVIRQADANRLAAREARPQAWSAVMPQIVGTADVLRDHSSGYQGSISEIGQPPVLQVLPLPSTVDTTTRGWAVNLRSNLFSWTNWMQIKAASAEVAQAEANYQAAEQDLILRVATAYFLVLSAEAGVEANSAALEAITRQLDQANKRFEVGLIAITDVQDAKAGHDTAAAAVIAAKRQLATAQYRLQEITGQQYDRLSRPGADMPLKGPEPLEESAWVQSSLQQNLSLISSRLAADIARDNVRAAFGGHLPTLDLVAGRSYSKLDSDQVIDYIPFSNVNSKLNDRQIGLQFTLPIFSGGFTQSKVRENEYRWIAAKEAVVQSSRATERQSRDAYLGVISGVARVQALRQARESSQTALKATEAGYDVGTRTSVDVLNARRVLVQAETDYANSKYDYIVSVLQLREAAGTLDRAQLQE
ncbi:MAG TPA: TolC family outer membrane protein, partial [Steroidobacteraceae bacterium]